LIAVGAMAVTADSAFAAPPGYRGHHHGGYNNNYRGGYNNYYRGAYSRPVYPAYNYGYNSGFGLNIVRPGGVGISIGAPSYGYPGGYYYQPYQYGFRGYAGRTWWGW
jgi:hypothetical protein